MQLSPIDLQRRQPETIVVGFIAASGLGVMLTRECPNWSLILRVGTELSSRKLAAVLRRAWLTKPSMPASWRT
jgi:hypothetical protein